MIVGLFTLLSVTAFSQTPVIPNIVFDKKTEYVNKYVELLDIKDTNALILKEAYGNFWFKGTNATYIVYFNNSSVKGYKVFEPFDSSLKVKVSSMKIKKSQYHFYWDFLNDCVKNNRFSIDESKLNITIKEDLEKGTMETMIVSDGTKYIFGLFQNNQIIEYYSSAPKTYIEKGFPGAEERQKLVDLMADVDSVIKKSE